MFLGKRLLSLLSILLLVPVATTTWGQISSATITGSVKDSTGAVVTKAAIVATEVSTGVQTKSISNERGQYTFSSLLTGNYTISATASGFRRFVRTGVFVASGDNVTVDIPLAVGDISATVVVTEAPPLLGTEDANLGQTVTNDLLEDLPLSGRNPLTVVQFTVGVVATTSPSGVRPFDNSGAAGFSVGGLPNKNGEVDMDGAPDNASDNAPGYVPPIDTIREVSVKVFSSDATYGHSGGLFVNQVTKSGTNRLHGSLSEFLQNSYLNAENFFARRTNNYKIPVSRQNQYGGTIGGPIYIPKVFDGRKKMFFFFGYEGFADSGSSSGFTSVPTAAERKGDFSGLLALGGPLPGPAECPGGPAGPTYNSQAIFDPASGHINQQCAALGYTVYDRTAFPNNNITLGTLPLSSVALATLKYFPLPNANTVGPNAATGQNNYFANLSKSGDRYNNEIGRLDYYLGHHRLFLTGRHNERQQYINQNFGPDDPATGNYLYRINWGGTLGDTYTINSSTVMDIRLNYTRFSQPTYTAGDGFDAASLGLPNLSTTHHIFPRLYFQSIYPLGTDQSGFTDGTAPFNSDDMFINILKTKGLHTVNFGMDGRKFQKGNFNFGNSSGAYYFDGSFDAAYSSDYYGAAVRGDVADFLLGLPSSANYDYNAHSVGNQTYLGVFLQDNWRVTRNLTLNSGLRVDKDFSPNEREATANNGFDTTNVSPFNAAATANYASKPNAILPVSAFKVLGGLTFNSPGNKLISTFPSVMFSPRFGFAYQLPFVKNTVMRGGFSIFVLPIFPFNNAIPQQGFSQNTQAPIVPYAPPTGPGTLSNPFPNGIVMPTGSTLGLATFGGNGITFLDPVIRNGYSERWHLNFQHQFPGNWLFDIFYEGSTGRRLPINRQLNFVQRQYETTASNPNLSAAVPNPFYGIIPNGGSLNSNPTIALSQLLMTYPQFTGVTEYNVPIGSSIYHALDISIQHRFGSGLSLNAVYQWSKLMEAVSFLNANDPAPEYRLSQFDHPTHAVISMSYAFPYGRGRRFGGKAPRWLDLPLGGWNVASSWFYQQGAPLSLGNFTPTGEPLHYNARQATQFFDTNNAPGKTCPAFNINAFINTVTTPGNAASAALACQATEASAYGPQPVNNIRVFGDQYSNIRQDAINEWDASVLKDFNIVTGTYFEMRLEAFNVNNRPMFGTPNLSPGSGSFGQITGTAYTANRVVQIGARLVF